MVYLSVGSRLFLKLYRMFPFIFSSIIDSDYGKKTTSSKIDDVIPMNYDFWKKDICVGRKIKSFDITQDVINSNTSINEKKIFYIFKKNTNRITYRIFNKISPTWIFLLKKFQ